MKDAKWQELDKDRRVMMKGWLDNQYPIIGMEPTRLFKETQPCSCCGETGWVPTSHKYLCVFCWVAAPYLAHNVQDSDVGLKDSDGKGTDRVSTNIPVGIEGTPREPDVYNSVVYVNTGDNQEFLRSLVPSENM